MENLNMDSIIGIFNALITVIEMLEKFFASIIVKKGYEGTDYYPDAE